jgi:hypothetical protein
VDALAVGHLGVTGLKTCLRAVPGLFAEGLLQQLHADGVAQGHAP